MDVKNIPNLNRRQLMWASALLLPATAAIAHGGDKEGSQRSASEFVESSNQRFAQAVLNRSARGLGDLYTKDASILPPNTPTIIGPGPIEAFWQGLVDAGLVYLHLETKIIEASALGGYTVGEFSLDLQLPDGTLTRDVGHYLTVLKFVPRVGWRFQSDAWSSQRPLA